MSTPVDARTHTVDFHRWVTVANGTGDLVCKDGAMNAPTGPGLGIAVDLGARRAALRGGRVTREGTRMSSILTLDEVPTHGALRASGASTLQADATSRSIRDAEADGIRTVGLPYLPTYCDHLACGKVRGDAVPVVTRPRTATVVVDAGNGFCHQRSKPVSARSSRPAHVWCRRAGHHPLVLCGRTRVVRGASWPGGGWSR